MSTEKKDQCHCTQQVRPGDVDPYGIMHHSVYFQMYELAFFDYIKKRLVLLCSISQRMMIQK